MDLTLEVGDLTESVEVQAAVPLVQSDSSELGVTVNESQVKELRLNGRDFVHLTRLIPGVTRGVPRSNNDSASNEGWRMSSTIAANGMRTRDNNFLLDGIDNNELNPNTVIIFPSVDAIEEFKVQTSTYLAEFGRANGGVVNIQIKSGTNQFHGGGFEFLRNDQSDANDLFNDKFGRAKPAFRRTAGRPRSISSMPGRRAVFTSCPLAKGGASAAASARWPTSCWAAGRWMRFLWREPDCRSR